MADEFLKITVKGIPELEKALAQFPSIVGEEMAAMVSEYLIEQLRGDNPYKYVSRADAYPDAPAGPGWFSDKQRRWFFAALKSGEITIPYQRTGALYYGWKAEGTGPSMVVYNDAPEAFWVQGPRGEYPGQSRHEEMVGWKTVDDAVNSLTDGVLQDMLTQVVSQTGTGGGFLQGVRAFIRKLFKR